MSTTVAPEDVEQLWIEFKNDPTSQELPSAGRNPFATGQVQRRTVWARLPEGWNWTTSSRPACSA